jgi:hypothetical protein
VPLFLVLPIALLVVQTQRLNQYCGGVEGQWPQYLFSRPQWPSIGTAGRL